MAAPATNIHLDEHRKLITTSGEFWVDGRLLGTGKWDNATRFIAFVPSWGNRWWVGVLADGGMHTASPATEEEAATVEPLHFEKFSAVSEHAPAKDIRLDEHKKLMMRTGEFYVSGKLIGYGRWLPGGKFLVFVAVWGDRWWVGVLASNGMKTKSTKTEEEALTTIPTHVEKFSLPLPDAPKADVRLAENNKLITRYGEFFVNSDLLGLGKWTAEGRFVVLVESWGSIWWVGVTVAGGMKTGTSKTEEEAGQSVPTHFERFGRQPEAPVGEVKLAEFSKVIKPTGEFFVEGALLGFGKWEPGRFIVFVESFGDRWWVGVLVEGGMKTATFRSEMEAETGQPEHFEAFACQQ